LASPVKITSFTITENAVCATVAFVGDVRTVSAGVARQLLERYPTLAEHACKSNGNRRFGEVLQGALLPHAVEHLAIDLLVRDAKAAGRQQAFAGNTSWANDEHGAMLVRVSYSDPAATQAAIKTAVDTINNLVNPANCGIVST
jgi:AmiR/NasT family two-component response regulator